MVGLGVVPLIALALAVFRLTRFITSDSFPPMAWARDRFEQHAPGHWADLVSCDWCVSLWLGIATVAAVEFAPARAVELVSLALALSAVASLLSLLAED